RILPDQWAISFLARGCALRAGTLARTSKGARIFSRSLDGRALRGVSAPTDAPRSGRPARLPLLSVSASSPFPLCVLCVKKAMLAAAAPQRRGGDGGGGGQAAPGEHVSVTRVERVPRHEGHLAHEHGGPEQLRALDDPAARVHHGRDAGVGGPPEVLLVLHGAEDRHGH